MTGGLAASPATAAAALALAGSIAGFGGLAIWRGGPGLRGWRTAALAAALLGLLGLVLRPWRAAPMADGRAVLITAGSGGAANPNSLISSRVGSSGWSSPLRLAENGGGGRWRALPDARTLWRNEPGLRRLEVRGYGLAEEDFEGFQGAVERFDPPPLPPGVTAALWPRRLVLGAPFVVEARVSPASTGRLQLVGPGGVEAEVDAAAARDGVTLTTVPKAAGRLLYRLALRAAGLPERKREPMGGRPGKPTGERMDKPTREPKGDLTGGPVHEQTGDLTRGPKGELTGEPGRERTADPSPEPNREPTGEPLDVSVEPARPPTVLLLFGAPGFEQQALLRWLAASGVPFVARQGLTRGRARVAALWPRAYGLQPPASPLTAAGLARFDAVLADGRSFQALPPRERAALASAVEAGLGLLLLDVAPAAGEERGLPLQSRAVAGAAAREARLSWPGEEPLPALAVPGREIVPREGVEPLVSDAEHRTLAARVPSGRGWVALSLVESSYLLPLDAGERAYGAFWARLLGAVARPDAAPRFELPMGPILAGRPLEAALLAPQGAPRGLEPVEGGQMSALTQLEVVESGRRSALPLYTAGPGRFAARLWPRREGWLRLSAGGTAAWVYASGGASWDAWMKSARVAATRARGAGRAAAAAAPAPPAPTRPRPWPRLPMYALFLGGAGLLWFLERVRPAGAADAS
jgi:hypothetical protein